MKALRTGDKTRGGEAASDSARAGTASPGHILPAACPPEVLEDAIEGLSGCAEDALSQAACQGILDPAAVISWTDRTERLLRFRFDRSELRSEVPAVAEELRRLLCEVDLPDSSSPETVTADFVASLVRLRTSIAEDVEAAFEGDPRPPGTRKSSFPIP